MSDDLQYGWRADNKRKFDDPVGPPLSAPPPRRSTGFSVPISSPPSGSQTQPSYNSVPPPAAEIQLAKQRAPEIAARLFNNAVAKRPRIENEGDDGVAADHASNPSAFPISSSQSGPFGLGSRTGSYIYQGTSKKIYVANGRVSVIVGKSGETIKYLQLQSGAKIQVTMDMDADPNSQSRPVELMGTPEQISKAEQLINDVLSEAEAGGSGILAARRFNTATPGTEQFVMKVPNNEVGLINGMGGETIKSMQIWSGALIQERAKEIDILKNEIQYMKMDMSSMFDRITKLEKDVHQTKISEDKPKVSSSAKGKQIISQSASAKPKAQLFKNLNLNDKFERPNRIVKPTQLIPPQLQTYVDTVQEEKAQRQAHIVNDYLTNLKKILDFLGTNPRQENVSEGEGYITVPEKGINKLVAYPGTSPQLIKTAYSYGVLHTVYTVSGKELEEIPEVFKAVKKYLTITKADLVYIRIFSAIAEIEGTEILPVINCVRIGLTQGMIEYETAKQEEILMPRIKKYVEQRRPKSMKMIFDELCHRYRSKKVWLYRSVNNQIIYSLSNKISDKTTMEIANWLESLAEPEKTSRTGAIKKKLLSKNNLKKYCMLMQGIAEHFCSECLKIPEPVILG